MSAIRVKLAHTSEKQAMERAEPNIPHNWRYPRRRRKEQPTEPKTLMEIEKLAIKTIKLMKKYSPVTEDDYYKVMYLLRLQHNLVGVNVIYNFLYTGSSTQPCLHLTKL